jgi:hypothetical protein
VVAMPHDSIWQRLKNGERVIVSAETLDVLADRFKDDSGADANLFFRQLATVPNPNRVGVKDEFIAFLKP